jgi:hypothetical protein
MPRVTWRVAAPAVAALAALVPLPAGVVERFYAQAWYPTIQPRLAAVTHLIPFALLDVVLVAAVAWGFWRAWLRWRTSHPSRIRRAAAFVLDLVGGAAVIYLLFLLCWGLNYRRLPASQRFAVRPELITPAARLVLVKHAAREINALHEEGRDDRGLTIDRVTADLAPGFARAVRALHVSWEPRVARPKHSLVARLFPFAAVDGMINPLGLEVLVSPDVLPFERPFVIAHEWAHLAGNAGESEASFVAWLACLHGGRTARYSGWLAVYLHLLRGLPASDVRRSMQQLGSGPQRDIQAIRERLRRAQPRIQSITWSVYDRYLRANRVDSGVASYDDVALLVLGSEFAAEHRQTGNLLH